MLIVQEKNEHLVIFSRRLSELINDLDIDQKDVAKGTGLTPTAISYYVSGKRMPGALELKALAQFFGVSMDYLLGWESAGDRVRKRIEDAAKKAEHHPPEQQDQVFQEELSRPPDPVLLELREMRSTLQQFLDRINQLEKAIFEQKGKTS